MVLESLDTLDWAGSSHAYGDASDVPGLIRDLFSATATVRDAATEALFSNIYHQGTVYPATVLALPFLIELLESEKTPDREAVVLLVACIMGGRGAYTQLYSKPLMNPFTRKPVEPPLDLDKRVRAEKLVVAEVHRLGARAVPWLIPYLRHADDSFRSDIVRALVHEVERADITLPALRDALALETDADVRELIANAVDELAQSHLKS